MEYEDIPITEPNFRRVVYGIWKKDPPTEDGFYWAYGRNGSFVEIVEVTQYGFLGCGVWTTTGKTVSVKEFSFWMGPILKPEPPYLYIKE